MSERETITLEDATQPGPESTDPDYRAWKEAKIKATVRQADENPNDTYTHEQVFGEIKQKFRP